LNLEARLAAVGALEMMGQAARPAVPALVRALGDPSPFMRWAAARTLGKLGPIDVSVTVPALVRLLCDRDFDVVLAGATALARYGPAAKDAVPALARAIATSDAEARVAAIQALN